MRMSVKLVPCSRKHVQCSSTVSCAWCWQDAWCNHSPVGCPQIAWSYAYQYEVCYVQPALPMAAPQKAAAELPQACTGTAITDKLQQQLAGPCWPPPLVQPSTHICHIIQLVNARHLVPAPNLRLRWQEDLAAAAAAAAEAAAAAAAAAADTEALMCYSKLQQQMNPV
jgi:hypothetical protein